MSKYNKIPEHLIPQIEAELGKASDAALARKYSAVAGFDIDRHAIFWMRKQRDIPPFQPKAYTRPKFTGRVEDKYPEVAKLLGRVPVTTIADYFGVSRSCVHAAAERLGISTSSIDPKSTIDQLLAAG